MPNTDIEKLSTAIDRSFLVEFSAFSKNSAIKTQDANEKTFRQKDKKIF